MALFADADCVYYSATRQDLHAKLAQHSISHVPSKDPVADEDLPIDMLKRSRSARSGANWRNHRNHYPWAGSLHQHPRIMSQLPSHPSLRSLMLNRYAPLIPSNCSSMTSLPTYTLSLLSHTNLPSALLSSTEKILTTPLSSRY